MSVTMKRMVVTPQIAAKWLSGHENYRNLRPKYAKRLAADMLAGNFHEVGDPIRFDSSGALIDGQHRLSAIVESGVSMPMWICKGVDNIEVVDCGTPRRAADSVRFATGIPHHKNAVAALRRLHSNGLTDISGCDQPTNLALTNPQIVNYVSEHPEFERAVNDGQAASHKKILMGSEAIAALHLAQVKSLDYDDVLGFLNTVRDGDGLRKGNPAHTLRERLIGAPAHGGSAATARMWFILRALEAQLSGQEIKMLRYRPRETAWPKF